MWDSSIGPLHYPISDQTIAGRLLLGLDEAPELLPASFFGWGDSKRWEPKDVYESLQFMRAQERMEGPGPAYVCNLLSAALPDAAGLPDEILPPPNPFFAKLKNAASTGHATGLTPLQEAVEKMDVKEVKRLLALKADGGYFISTECMNALHHAALASTREGLKWEDSVSIVEALKGNG